MRKTNRCLQISARSRYAMLILLDLANHRDELRSIREMSEENRLPNYYIARLLNPLNKAGYIESRPGPAGGQRLIREPESISFLEIIDLMDETFAIRSCLINPGFCAEEAQCPAKASWQRINERFRDILRGFTLSDLVEEKRRIGGHSAKTRRPADRPLPQRPKGRIKGQLSAPDAPGNARSGKREKIRGRNAKSIPASPSESAAPGHRAQSDIEGGRFTRSVPRGRRRGSLA